MDNVYIGQIGLDNIDYNNKNADIGLVIRGNKELNRGIMSDALIALINWTKTYLRIYDIYLDVYSDNVHAIRYYKENVFVEISYTPIIQVEEDGILKLKKTSKNDSYEKNLIRMRYVGI